MLLKECSWLADENICQEAISIFSKQLDMISVSEAGLKSATDTDILEYAYQNKRVVLTQDSDFGKLIFANKQAFLGVVYLRPDHLLAEYHVDTLKRLLSEEIFLVPPFLIVAEKSNNQIKVRVRNDLVIY